MERGWARTVIRVVLYSAGESEPRRTGAEDAGGARHPPPAPPTHIASGSSRSTVVVEAGDAPTAASSSIPDGSAPVRSASVTVQYECVAELIDGRDLSPPFPHCQTGINVKGCPFRMMVSGLKPPQEDLLSP